MPDIALHIVQRGHNRQDCFLHDTDRLVYLASLRDLLTHARCALHAYCLMTNHVHLLLTPSAPQACAALMRNLGQRYAQYFNRRYQRSGTLWEGRFRSCLVESAQYVIACYRYIELNPVRAGMARSAAMYRWSSHNGNTGHASNKLLTPHPEYLSLAAGDTARHASYQHLFAERDDPGFLTAIRDATNGGFALVGERLKSILPADQRQRLERKPPGPRPRLMPEPDDLLSELEGELGLRPRIT